MSRYDRRQQLKSEKEQGRRWDLAAGSHVWLYLRHSPGDNQTIDSQLSAMKEWCAQSGWIVEAIFIDEGVEGSKEQRAHFQEMMALSRQVPRPVDGIAVWSFSRFARSQLDAQFYKADLRKRGYIVVSKIDDIPNNEMAPLMEAFIDWKNQRFLDDLSADTRRGQLYVVQQGFWINGRPVWISLGSRRNGSEAYRCYQIWKSACER